jgi:hypothetical protein
MTYDEIAEERGIKRSGAVRLVQRMKWRRQGGNDGRARILVPHDEQERVRGTRQPDGAQPDGARDGGNDGGGTLALFGQALELLRGQLASAEARATAAETRADQARQAAQEAQERAAQLEAEGKLGWWAQGRLRRAWDGWRGR